MNGKSQLSRVLSGERFRRIEGVFRQHFQFGLVSAIGKLPIIQGRNIQKAAEFLFDLLYEVSGLDGRAIRWRRRRSEQQSQIGEFIQEKKKLGTDTGNIPCKANVSYWGRSR